MTIREVAAEAASPRLVPEPARPRRRPLLVGELLVVLCLLVLYDLARRSAEVRRGSALRHGEDLLDLEARLGLDVEHAVNTWTAAHPAWSDATSYVYEFAHLLVTMAVLAACWWWRPALYRSARTALVGINAVGLAVFLLFPVAPPRLLLGHGFVDTVALAGFGTTHGGPVAADQYGALPSLHLGWAVWAAVVVGRMLAGRAGRPWLALYPAVVTVVVVVTGNHYLLDAVAGTATALLSLWTADRWRAGSRRKPESTLLAPRKAATP